MGGVWYVVRVCVRLGFRAHAPTSIVGRLLPVLSSDFLRIKSSFLERIDGIIAEFSSVIPHAVVFPETHSIEAHAYGYWL